MDALSGLLLLAAAVMAGLWIVVLVRAAVGLLGQDGGRRAVRSGSRRGPGRWRLPWRTR